MVSYYIQDPLETNRARERNYQLTEEHVTEFPKHVRFLATTIFCRLTARHKLYNQNRLGFLFHLSLVSSLVIIDI